MRDGLRVRLQRILSCPDETKWAERVHEAFRRVLSFDPRKTWIESVDGTHVARKRTSEFEHSQWIHAEEFLYDLPLRILDGIRISVAPVTHWSSDEGIISSVLSGVNFEYILRHASDDDKREFIPLFVAFFKGLQRDGFLWGDPAPRNMVLDRDVRCISLIDFERPCVFMSQPVSSEVFSRFIRTYAREEFACVLTADEQKLLFYEFLVDEQCEVIPRSEIRSKRKRSLLELRMGKAESYPVNVVQEIEDTMVNIATPFVNEGAMFYPMDLIDPITRKQGAHYYGGLALELSRLDEHGRFELLISKAVELKLAVV